MSLFFFETGCHISQDGLEIPLYLRIVLNTHPTASPPQCWDLKAQTATPVPHCTCLSADFCVTFLGLELEQLNETNPVVFELASISQAVVSRARL